MKTQTRNHLGQRAYTLIEALVASSILLIGVGAAASMSLSLVTQEEINERSVKAFNYLDNAARLYQMGVDPADITALLPSETSVTGLTFSSRNLAVTGIGTIPAITLNLSYKPTGATAAAATNTWTGGDKDAIRSESIEIIRSNSFLTAPLPRVQFFHP